MVRREFLPLPSHLSQCLSPSESAAKTLPAIHPLFKSRDLSESPRAPNSHVYTASATPVVTTFRAWIRTLYRYPRRTQSRGLVAVHGINTSLVPKSSFVVWRQPRHTNTSQTTSNHLRAFSRHSHAGKQCFANIKDRIRRGRAIGCTIRHFLAHISITIIMARFIANELPSL